MYGIDISHHQKGLNPQTIPCDFVIIKATEGTRYVDKTAISNYHKARQAGRLTGFYHFARPDHNNPQQEANHFLNTLASFGVINEPNLLVIDWEQPGTEKNTTWANTWIDYVQARTGRTPVIYMGVYAEKPANWQYTAKKYPLWLAGYPSYLPLGFNPPAFPYRLKHNWEFIIWQYSSAGGAPGYPRQIDLNLGYLSKNRWLEIATGKKQTNNPSKNKTNSEGEKNMFITRCTDGACFLIQDGTLVSWIPDPKIVDGIRKCGLRFTDNNLSRQDFDYIAKYLNQTVAPGLYKNLDAKTVANALIEPLTKAVLDAAPGTLTAQTIQEATEAAVRKVFQDAATNEDNK